MRANPVTVRFVECMEDCSLVPRIAFFISSGKERKRREEERREEKKRRGEKRIERKGKKERKSVTEVLEH